VRLLESATAEDLEGGLAEILTIDDAVLVEEYVTGAELTCGVLELTDTPTALPPTLISAQSADWYDFKSKYSQGGSRHQCPAPLSSELTRALKDAAVRAHEALSLRDLSRTDIILRDDGSFVLLETNTLPGMTDVSLFPEAAAAAGIGFAELIEGLCQRALDRGGFVPKPETAMP
jgi:D-alanine-D-alanine ligase